MTDLLLNYRACGAECRDDYLRGIANENGLPLACVQTIADRAWRTRGLRGVGPDLRRASGAGSVSAAAPVTIATAREQIARIARLNDLARSAMGGAAQGSGDPKDRWKGCGGDACTAVRTSRKACAMERKLSNRH